MQRFLLAWSFVLCACSGSSSPTPDAAGGPAARTFGAACTDPVDNSTECDSHVCTNTIDMLGHSVCSQKCTMLKAIDASCPTGSMGTYCNMKGYCKP